MKEDFQKFMELVETDEALQKRLEEAGKGYDGERTEEAVFHTVLEPIAKEAGFSFTLDDMKQSVHELNLDEMSQVAGGGDGCIQGRRGDGEGGGAGFYICNWWGFGLGWTVGTLNGEIDSGGICVFLGGGQGQGLCLTVGGAWNNFKE